MSNALNPVMTPGEMDCFRRHVQDAHIYLEFGCGGSTRMAAESGVNKLFSVDTDKEWVLTCRRHPSIAPLVKAGRAVLQWVDVGPVSRWGYPADRQHTDRWPNYSLAIWDKIDGVPDVVLVDGRWRVSTAVQTLLRCGENTKLLFHDFTLRASYSRILPFIEVIEEVDTLLVCRGKPEADLKALSLLGFASLFIAR